MNTATFGLKLRRLRLERGLTARALAESAGIARSSVNRYEAGQAEPKPATIARLARSLRVDPAEFLKDGKRPKRETAHDREVFNLLNVAHSLDRDRLTTLTAFARFLHKQQRQSNR